MADTKVFDVRLYNIVVLGVAFLLLFTAFETASMAEESVLASEKKNTNETFTGDGYTSLSIIYIVFSAANWIAPPIVAVLGPKLTMFAGSILYFVFILSFLKPMVWALYLGSVLVGLGAAILWTAQGNFLTINSDTETLSRNSGIFWALSQCSLLLGNIYTYFVLKGSTDITDAERTELFIGLSGAALLGVLSLLLLRKPVSTDTKPLVNLSPSSTGGKENPLQTIKRAFYLLRTREFIFLSFSIAYTGIELTFFSGVFGTCISNTPQFGDTAKGLIGISGMFIGVGEILGGAAFGLLGKRTNKYGRDPIVLLGFLSHIVTFFLIFMNIPNGSPKNAEDSSTYMTPNQDLAIFASFLLGFGDSCFNTQLYSILGFMFPEDSSPAFALFKFVQSIAAAAAFYYSEVLKLYYQLLILTVLGSIGTLAFCVVEWELARLNPSDNSQKDTELLITG